MMFSVCTVALGIKPWRCGVWECWLVGDSPVSWMALQGSGDGMYCLPLYYGVSGVARGETKVSAYGVWVVLGLWTDWVRCYSTWPRMSLLIS